MRTAQSLPLVLGSLFLGSALASCRSTPEVQTVPLSFIQLYDQAKPDGLIEMELERDGTVREVEADVPIDSLPKAVIDAALDRARGGSVTGAEKELRGETEMWEVKLLVDGRNWEYVVDSTGRVVETEQEIAFADAPPLVMNAAERRVPGGKMKSVELIERGPEREYHVKTERDGARYKLVIAPDGRILRAVREQRAEIEIPLP